MMQIDKSQRNILHMQQFLNYDYTINYTFLSLVQDILVNYSLNINNL